MASNPPVENAVGPRGLELVSARPSGPGPHKAPLLFVHGLGHGAWCWEHWLQAAAEAGHPAYAVSLRGHGGSAGALRTARLSDYVDDVVHTAASLPQRAVLVGHSMGGLVVQKALARYAAHAGVLVAPVPAHPALGSLLAIARRHPADAARMSSGAHCPCAANTCSTSWTPPRPSGSRTGAARSHPWHSSSSCCTDRPRSPEATLRCSCSPPRRRARALWLTFAAPPSTTTPSCARSPAWATT